jgi:hypothetical protein
MFDDIPQVSNCNTTSAFPSLSYNNTYIATVFAVMFAVSVASEGIIKYVLKYYQYMDINKHKLAKNQSTRQGNILSIIITSILSILAINNIILNPTCHYIKSYDPHTVFIPMMLLFTYFAYDMIFGTPQRLHILHHMIGFFAIYMSFYSGYNFIAYYTFACFVTEISTVPLVMSHITKGKFKEFWMLLFAITFTIVRPLYLLSVINDSIKCFEYEYINVIIIVSLIALYSLNMYWFYLICDKMYRKIINSMHNDKTY